ncbi:hypothetical protein IV203_003482 [Nitzschia inconspicua]|uniref:RING-type domain-containing protein n=1 Tax=Nitzschia inconspicua TaxID=303405 RepID=A0A9K3L3L2_9STRA|nr:hypothetical protein IV203_003482 [Nitzschia inconspicua]
MSSKKSPTTTAEEPQDCPICLETLTISEQVVYPLPCQKCDFNYCNRCVDGFCKSAQDDFQVASDGSRQVKVTVSCPQCRSKYPMDIHDILLLRQAHSLGTSVIRNGELLGDSDLTATQLSWKRDFMAASTRDKVRDAQALYLYCTKGKLDESVVEKEAMVWKTLLEKLPVEVEEEDHNEDDIEGAVSHDGDQSQSSRSTKKSSPRNKKPTVDDTLFQGLHDFISKDEKIYLTELFASGDLRSLAQAAMILHGILRLSMSGKAAAFAKQNEVPMSKYEMQKQVDLIAKTKASFPLPNHMPGYFLIPSYSKRDGFMTLADQEWDGSIAPPQVSQRVFDQIYGSLYKPPQDEYPKAVVTVQGVRGPVGRLGLRRGDVVTHVNEVEWKGSAIDLQQYIYDCHTNHPQDEISLMVNCTSATATFLKLRNDMVQRSRQPSK